MIDARLDRGLQPERTTLSRVRTAAALAVLGGLFIRYGPIEVGIMLAVCAGAMLAAAPHRHRRLREQFERGRLRADWWWNVFLLAAVLVAAGAMPVLSGAR
ncbi:DUF202 domain-containing protein [Nocardia sp. NPDC052254]|uniref:DUF202 domain-containing protein n=1 Tax=Nocardia sp. NPDC052254 TaxID=3155681 RepID=UPI003447D790